MCENDAFAAIRFWLGWNCQSFGEGGVLHWRRETPHAGAGPILFASEEAKRLGTFSGRRGEEGMNAEARRHRGRNAEKGKTSGHSLSKQKRGRSGFSPTRACRRAEAAPYSESFLRRFRVAWDSFQIWRGGRGDVRCIRRSSGRALRSNSGQECIIPLLYLHAWNIPTRL
jgi:hypothetical protein